MTALSHDVRDAARMLARNLGLTAVAVVSLGLGIGANSTIFSFLSALLLRPLPVKEPDRVVAVFTSDHSGPLYGGSSYPDYLDFREKTTAFSGLAAYTPAPMSLSEGSQTDRVFGELVTANYFEVAGLDAAHGRVFRMEEERDKSSPVLVLSDGLWRRRFGSDPTVLGRSLTLNGHPFTVVGIAPRGFPGMMRGLAVDLWVPMTMPGAIPSRDRLDSRGSRWLFLIGRLNPGAGVSNAQAQLSVLASQLQQAYPEAWTDVRKNRRAITVVPESRARILPQARGIVIGFLGLLLAVVSLVLLMACNNVAGLLLARATKRHRETAIRVALGASRGRLIRALLTESVMLSLLAGGAGVLVAVWGTDALMALRPPVPFPVELDLRLDWRVVGFTAMLAVLTGVVLGIAPALHASRTEPLPALKDDSLWAPRTTGSWPLRRILVVAQTAASVVLLIGAGLFLQSLRNAHGIDAGFDARNLLLFSLDLKLTGHAEDSGRQVYRQLLDRTQSLPGVRSVSLATQVPLGLGGARRRIDIEGYEPAPGEDMEVHTTSVGPAYFRTMGMRLARGREFSDSDGPNAPPVVIVNEVFVRRYWPGQDAIGKRIDVGARGGAVATATVVGIASDGKYVTLGEDPTPFFYVPFFQRYDPEATIHVRTEADPRAMVAALRRELKALDASLPVFDVKTMSDHMGLSLLPARIAGHVLGVFGAVALVLATVGIYGVMAYSVTQRTRELAVRAALGAQPRDLLSLVIGQGVKLASTGLGIGVLLALALAHALSSLLYGVDAYDPATFIAVPAFLTGIAFLASYLPARWAMKVDPMVALRQG